MAEYNPVCFICLSEDGEMCRPCNCPRQVHAQCVARWQVYNAGREEEKTCRSVNDGSQRLDSVPDPWINAWIIVHVALFRRRFTWAELPPLEFSLVSVLVSVPVYMALHLFWSFLIRFCKATLPDWRLVPAQSRSNIDQDLVAAADPSHTDTQQQQLVSAFMRISFNGKSHKV